MITGYIQKVHKRYNIMFVVHFLLVIHEMNC